MTTPPALKACSMGRSAGLDLPISAGPSHRAERTRVAKRPMRRRPVDRRRPDDRVAGRLDLTFRREAASRATDRPDRIPHDRGPNGQRHAWRDARVAARERMRRAPGTGWRHEPRPSVCHTDGADASLHVRMVPPIRLRAGAGAEWPVPRRWPHDRQPCRALVRRWRGTSRQHPAPGAAWLRDGPGWCPRRRARRGR